MNINRLLYILLISAITIAGFSMYKQNDVGKISLQFAEFSFETNLVVFGSAVLCALFIVLFFIRSVQGIFHLIVQFREQRLQRLKEKARLSMSQGLIEYAEGRFKQSEKILLQYIQYSENPLLVYLTAARAAQQLGAYSRRDEYLQLAHIDTPNADVAISLTKAEMQLAHKQNEQALATLTQLNELSPNHSYVLTLLANTYHYLQDWDELEKILPQLKKYGNLSDDSFRLFEINVCNGQLSNIVKNNPQAEDATRKLLAFWSEVPGHLQVLPETIEHYARQLLACNADREAESALRQYLHKHWHESTMLLYSELDVSIDNQQLEMVESWLHDHQHNAWLLLALGKMCIMCSLWGKARNYLEASIAINPMPENYLRLARLLEEHMNDPVAAQEYYRQGLHLLAGNYHEQKLLDNTAPEQADKTPLLKIVKT